MVNNTQQIAKAKGRPLLQWVGKNPLERVEYYPAQEKEVYGNKSSKEFNKLFWGDNLQVLSHLLKDYRGKIDLIYIDPPFDSKADYVKKVKIRGEKVEGQSQSLLEEKQYTDIWENDEYLQFMYERLLLLRELLADTGSIYLQCDYRKNSHLRLLMDEIFGEDNLLNEIIYGYRIQGIAQKFWARKHQTLLYYRKTEKYNFNPEKEQVIYEKPFIDTKFEEAKYQLTQKEYQQFCGLLKQNKPIPDKYKSQIFNKYYSEVFVRDVWDSGITKPFISGSNEYLGYPTQKSEGLLERIIKASSKEGDVVLDCFCGSGTTMAVAQKLGRCWIGCDINIGAIQTSSKRITKIIENQLKRNDKLFKDDFKGLLAFKIYNVNEYDIFKNEIEAKEIVMDMYGVEPIKRSYFDGILDNNFVKIMPLNRVLNKLDIKTVLKSIENSIDNFTVKKTSKSAEAVYEQGVIIICSGAELDTTNYLRKENKIEVKVEIRDILNDKKNLIFKQKPEAKIDVKTVGKKLIVEIKEFYSPILMRKLELENETVIDKKNQAKVDDFKQAIDSVAIDIDYNGKLFNAEIIDLPTKQEMIKAQYQYDYKNAGANTVAVKIVDVLGEEYFETFTIKV